MHIVIYISVITWLFLSIYIKLCAPQGQGPPIFFLTLYPSASIAHTRPSTTVHGVTKSLKHDLVTELQQH